MFRKNAAEVQHIFMISFTFLRCDFPVIGEPDIYDLSVAWDSVLVRQYFVELDYFALFYYVLYLYILRI